MNSSFSVQFHEFLDDHFNLYVSSLSSRMNSGGCGSSVSSGYAISIDERKCSDNFSDRVFVVVAVI